MLIGVNGFKGAGKDTIADYLVAKHNFRKISFADPLKDLVCKMLEINREDLERYKNIDVDVQFRGRPITFRKFLQNLGDGARDVFGGDFWIEQAIEKISPGHHYVFSDARYDNELLAIRGYDGYNIQVIRPGVESDGHASEMPPNINYIDYLIRNDGTPQQLFAQVEHALTAFAKAKSDG